MKKSTGTNGNILLTKWKDKKEILCVSTMETKVKGKTSLKPQ